MRAGGRGTSAYRGSPPTFLATPTEAVWELAEHRYIYIEERTEGTSTPIFRAPIFSPSSWAETLYVIEPASQTGHGPGDDDAGLNGAGKTTCSACCWACCVPIRDAS
jgi:hypothetical protein